MPEAFSADWANAVARRLAASDDYRQAAARWKGDLVLAHPARGEPAAAAYLDLHQGECREARVAGAGDLATARFVLRADVETWRGLLHGTVSPASAFAGGSLCLERGGLLALMPHMAAARELVRAAAQVETTFPDEAVGVPEEPGARPAGEEGAVEERVGLARSAAASAEAPGPTRTFRSTSAAGLDFDSPPMRLWEKSKQFGVWNPAEIDFSQDRRDWLALDDRERELLLHLGSLFEAGEESVVLDLLPLLQVVAAEGRLEEELYLTSFLWEEAKHVEAFRRFFDEVTGERGDLAHFHSASYRRIFYDELPAAMGRLREDASPVAQAEASTTYNLIVEGVLAETGYHFYYQVLAGNGILPGMQKVVSLLKADEARHLAYGVFLLTRLVAEHGEPVWEAIVARLERLLEPALGVIREVFERYEPEPPFGLELEPYLEFATRQFEARRQRIELARRQTLAQVLAGGR